MLLRVLEMRMGHPVTFFWAHNKWKIIIGVDLTSHEQWFVDVSRMEKNFK